MSTKKKKLQILQTKLEISSASKHSNDLFRSQHDMRQGMYCRVYLFIYLFIN